MVKSSMYLTMAQRWGYVDGVAQLNVHHFTGHEPPTPQQYLHGTVSIILDGLDLDLPPPHVECGSEGQLLMSMEDILAEEVRRRVGCGGCFSAVGDGIILQAGNLQRSVVATTSIGDGCSDRSVSPTLEELST